MIQFNLLTPQDQLWNEVAEFARTCSWRAGKSLWEKMGYGHWQSWERVLCATADGKLAGFCTFTKHDSLPDRLPYTPFIGYLFVEEAYRGQRLSQKMIEEVCQYAVSIGTERIYVVSNEFGLYEKYGFTLLSYETTCSGRLEQLFYRDLLR